MSIYEYKTRIRYSEIGPDKKLTITALLDLFQNCSSFQSEDLNVGVDYLHANNRAWVLSSWQVCIDDLPTFCDEVTLRTFPSGLKMALAYRNYEMLDKDGKRLACANSIWAYIDTVKLIPVRCPASEAETYGTHPALDMEPMPRKIEVPKAMEALEPFQVKKYFIDTNNHVNNARYVQAASDYLPSDFKYDIVRAEYKKSALLGDTIYPAINKEPGRITVTLSDSCGNIYTTVQFLNKNML